MIALGLLVDFVQTLGDALQCDLTTLHGFFLDTNFARVRYWDVYQLLKEFVLLLSFVVNLPRDLKRG